MECAILATMMFRFQLCTGRLPLAGVWAKIQGCSFLKRIVVVWTVSGMAVALVERSSIDASLTRRSSPLIRITWPCPFYPPPPKEETILVASEDNSPVVCVLCLRNVCLFFDVSAPRMLDYVSLFPPLSVFILPAGFSTVSSTAPERHFGGIWRGFAQSHRLCFVFAQVTGYTGFLFAIILATISIRFFCGDYVSFYLHAHHYTSTTTQGFFWQYASVSKK